MKFSPQTQSVYKILLKSAHPLSVKEIASLMHIPPARVYRLTNPLIEIGLITKSLTYPYKFTAKPINEGLSLYLLHQNSWFTEQFPFNSKVKDSNKNDISLSFIQSREELMNQSSLEISKSSKSVDILRSGHEIPADVMLEVTRAKQRGVTTRMLIQDYSVENVDQVKNWQENGILVRKSSRKHARLMIYDNSTVYFMSYKHSDSDKDMGVKISYPPLALLLSQLFEQWWEEAEII